jgi:MFS family permease
MITLSWMATRAVASYPAAFRERYQLEMLDLIDSNGASVRTVVDLLRGSTLAWLRPIVLPREPEERRRRRLQATVATTWVAWCAGFLIAPTINRDLLDPTPIHIPTLVPPLLSFGVIVVAVGCLLIAIAGIPVLTEIVRSAWHGQDRRILRPLILIAAFVGLEILGLIGIVLWRRTYPPMQANPHFPTLLWIAVVVWAIGFLLMLASAGFGPALMITRAAPSIKVLRIGGMLALPLAMLLALATLSSFIATILMVSVERIDGITPAFTIVVLAVAVVASVTALVSASRGFRVAYQFDL